MCVRNSDKKRMNMRLEYVEAPDRVVEGLSQSEEQPICASHWPGNKQELLDR